MFTTTAAGELISSHIADYVQSSVKIRGVGGLFSIFEDSKGGLWLEPIFHGIIHFNPGTRVYKTYTQPNEPNYIVGKASYKVFEDNRGMVWANMKGGGFGYYDREKLADPLDSDVVEVYKEECNHIRLKTKH